MNYIRLLAGLRGGFQKALPDGGYVLSGLQNHQPNRPLPRLSSRTASPSASVQSASTAQRYRYKARVNSAWVGDIRRRWPPSISAPARIHRLQRPCSGRTKVETTAARAVRSIPARSQQPANPVEQAGRGLLREQHHWRIPELLQRQIAACCERMVAMQRHHHRPRSRILTRMPCCSRTAAARRRYPVPLSQHRRQRRHIGLPLYLHRHVLYLKLTNERKFGMKSI